MQVFQKLITDHTHNIENMLARINYITPILISIDARLCTEFEDSTLIEFLKQNHLNKSTNDR